MLSSGQRNSSNCWCVLQHGHFADARHWKVKAHLPKKSRVPISLLSKAIHQDPNLPVKYIIYMFSDICSESKELAIYSVENCLKEISFSWIFTIKKIKKLKTNRKKTIQFFVSEKKNPWMVVLAMFLSFTPAVFWVNSFCGVRNTVVYQRSATNKTLMTFRLCVSQATAKVNTLKQIVKSL